MLRLCNRGFEKIIYLQDSLMLRAKLLFYVRNTTMTLTMMENYHELLL